jgi:hypothetical protein
MAQPESISDRIRSSYTEDSLNPGTSREKVTALIDPSQLPLPVDASGLSSSEYSKIINADDKLETYVWLDFNSRKLRRVSTITYMADSVSLTAQVVDTFNYTLSSGEYRLDNITRTYTP